MSYLPDNSAPANLTSHAHYTPLLDHGSARLNHGADLDRAVVRYRYTCLASCPGVWGYASRLLLLLLLGCGPDMRPLVHNTALSNVNGSRLRLDLGARVHKTLGAERDGVNTGQDRGIRNDQGGGEAHGGLRAGL